MRMSRLMLAWQIYWSTHTNDAEYAVAGDWQIEGQDTRLEVSSLDVCRPGNSALSDIGRTISRPVILSPSSEGRPSKCLQLALERMINLSQPFKGQQATRHTHHLILPHDTEKAMRTSTPTQRWTAPLCSALLYQSIIPCTKQMDSSRSLNLSDQAFPQHSDLSLYRSINPTALALSCHESFTSASERCLFFPDSIQVVLFCIIPLASEAQGSLYE